MLPVTDVFERSFIMDNQNLLNEMYQNLQMVLNTMPELTQATSDCDLKGCLEQQEQQFQDFFSRVKQAMTKDMQQPEEIGEIQKKYVEWMTKMKAIADKSTSHLAEMSIQGYTMGMIQLIQSSHKNCDASKDNLSMASDLVKLYEESIDSLKKYL